METPTRDERTGRLVAGHGRIARLILSQQDGSDPPEGITLGDGDWLVPVTCGWASANDYEARAYLISSNKSSEAGGWDSAELWGELSSLSEHGGLDGLGVGDDEMGALSRFAAAAGLPGSTPEEEWVGMPDYEQTNMRGLSITVHFKSEAEQTKFFKLLGRPVSRTFWWPEGDGHIGSTSSEEYVAADG